MNNILRDWVKSALSKWHTNPYVQSKSDLLVIESPYFSKPLNYDNDSTRLAFIVASRDNSYDTPWRISTQSYTRRYHKDGSVSDGDFDYGKTVVARCDRDVLRAFAEFQFEKLAAGFDEHQRDKSTYIYGLPVNQVLKFLDIYAPEQDNKPKPPTAA